MNKNRGSCGGCGSKPQQATPVNTSKTLEIDYNRVVGPIPKTIPFEVDFHLRNFKEIEAFGYGDTGQNHGSLVNTQKTSEKDSNKAVKVALGFDPQPLGLL